MTSTDYMSRLEAIERKLDECRSQDPTDERLPALAREIADLRTAIEEAQ